MCGVRHGTLWFAQRGEVCTEERRGRLKQGMNRRVNLRHALRTGAASIVADGQVMECWCAQWCATGYYRQRQGSLYGEHRRCEVVSGKASRRCVVMRGRAKNGTKWQALESFGRPYQGVYYECGTMALSKGNTARA